MSICDNFEGALMKAIRSLEQHVDSLMSYDFTGLSDEELEAQLHVVDDRRIWVIAEALRRGVSYDHIYEITKIDRWFIDKLAILTEVRTRRQRPHRRKRFWFLVPVRSVSVRVSSLISVPYTVPGHLPRKAGRPSLSTTTRRPFPPTLILQTSCILSR